MDTDVRLTEQQAEQILRRTEYWHYPFDLPWGHVASDKPGTQDRHAQRRRHFFEPLLAGSGGSLRGKRVLDLGCCQGHWSLEAARRRRSPPQRGRSGSVQGGRTFRGAHGEDPPSSNGWVGG